MHYQHPHRALTAKQLQTSRKPMYGINSRVKSRAANKMQPRKAAATENIISRLLAALIFIAC